MNPNFAQREVVDLEFLTLEDEKPYMKLDFANVTTTGLTASRVYARGGSGAPKRIAFDGEREGTLKIETQITNMALYGMITGSAIGDDYYKVKIETLTSTDPGRIITLTETHVAGSVNVYAENDDYGAEVSISVNGSAVTVPSAATKYIAHYIVAVSNNASTKSISINKDTFPDAFIVYGKSTVKTEDDEIAPMYLKYYKAQPQTDFEVTMSNTGDPSTITITCDLLADEDGNIFDMAIDGTTVT